MGFAGGLIVYLSAMSSISKEVLEYGQLEPLSSFKELIYIVIPLIFPTIVTYIVITIGGFFINAGHFYSFFGGNATHYTPFDTLGYYFFIKVAGNKAVTEADFTYAAAGGILFTLIVAPVTIITKNLLEKYGPSED
jgi:ABC-type sugar transport system permease subunit